MVTCLEDWWVVSILVAWAKGFISLDEVLEVLTCITVGLLQTG